MSGVDLDKEELRIAILDHFGNDGFHELLFDMEIDYEEISGSTYRQKVMGAIDYCEHRGRLRELVDECCRKRENFPIRLKQSGYLGEQKPVVKRLNSSHDSSEGLRRGINLWLTSFVFTHLYWMGWLLGLWITRQAIDNLFINSFPSSFLETFFYGVGILSFIPCIRFTLTDLAEILQQIKEFRNGLSETFSGNPKDEQMDDTDR